MIRKIYFAFVFAALLGTTSMAFAQNNNDSADDQAELKTGRYSGTFDVTSTPKKKVLATLEILSVQEDFGYLKLRANLIFALGHHGSHEYISYEYATVVFDPETKKLSFDDTNQELVLLNVTLDGSMLKGKFLSAANGAEGQFNLYFKRSFDLPPIGSQPTEFQDDSNRTLSEQRTLSAAEKAKTFLQDSEVIKILAGDYRGKCDKNDVALQLLTSRSRQGQAPGRRNPFGQYDISGSWGTMSSSERNLGMRKSSAFTSGTYDFFTGELTLSGHPKAISCLVKGDSILCGKCLLKRSSSDLYFSTPIPGSLAAQLEDPPYFKRAFTLDRSKYEEITSDPDPSEISGIYSGYLHNEHLNIYQKMRINISAYYHQYYENGPKTLVFNTLSQLYFLGGEEKISYRFNKRTWLLSNNAMMIQGDPETFAVIRDWRKNLIILDWYSQNYGRIGTVELTRDETPVLPSEFVQVSSMASHFLGPKLKLKLKAKLSGRKDYEMSNPYFPLDILGEMSLNIDPGIILPIETGAYDFYTGAVVIRTKSGNSLYGSMNDTGSGLRLFLSGVNWLSYPVFEMNFEEYSRVK